MSNGFGFISCTNLVDLGEFSLGLEKEKSLGSVKNCVGTSNDPSTSSFKLLQVYDVIF